MISGRDEQHRLDALLSGLEDEFISLDDLEILSEDEDEFADIEHVRALIQSQIDACASINHPQPETNLGRVSSKSQSRQWKVVPMTVPEKADERRRLLEMIVANQPDLPRHVQVAFSANEEPNDSVIDDMVAELIRYGILKRTEADS